MKYRFALIAMGAVMIGSGSCKKNEEPVKREIVQVALDAKQKALVTANNDFGFDLFRQINISESENKNIFISPLSVSLALAMAYNGAGGETRTEMQNALRFPDFSPGEINDYFKLISTTLTGLDPTVAFNIANSIWYRKEFSVLPSFLQVNRDYFNAEVQSLDFSDPAALNTINGWVADKTHDKIKKVLDNITGDQVMFLINAIYFKGRWTYEFKKDNTADRTFAGTDNTETSVPFMNQKGSFRYYANDSLQMVEMPYGQQNFSMVVILPGNGHTVSSLANNLTPAAWNSWLSDTVRRNVEISIPRFKFEYEKFLNADMQALGMNLAFFPGADFSNITTENDIYISFIKHNSFVEVNEEGTEAAAVTTIGFGETSMPPEPEFIPFIADHPFLFVIRETTTNAILFMGKINSVPGDQ
jgi:serine protease inhibitor